jgi:DNA-binding transcriptional MerR regulator
MYKFKKITCFKPLRAYFYRMSESFEIPSLSKLYYDIGEVANMFSINASNLRYWEKEFSQLKPKKSANGKRKYSQDDIRLIATIHHLVKSRGYTIEGARKHLYGNKAEAVDKAEVIQKLNYVKKELQKILRTMNAE